MRDSIIVDVDELCSSVQEIKRTGKKYVKITLYEPLEDDGSDEVPASLGFQVADNGVCVDCSEVYAPEDEAELNKEFEDSLIHSSLDF